MSYNDPNQPGYQPHTSPEPMHPAIPMVVSLFFPGGGLFFVPGKAGLAVVAILCWIGYVVMSIILSTIVIGICFLLFIPVIHVLAAVHSYDASAKTSGGKFSPILFKN